MKSSETSLGENSKKTKELFICKLCDYTSSVKFSYDRHLLSNKHIKLAQNEANNEKNEKVNICECGKVYNSRTTLWRHKKKCINVNNKLDEQSLVLEILKQNQEYQKLLLLQQQQILELTAKSCGNILNN